MHKVLLFGPTIAQFEGAYGGGMGGYTRKMRLYLDFFKDEEIQFIPCYHSVRGQSRSEILILRLLKDIWSFAKTIFSTKPEIVHILAQYRTAIYREYCVVLISKIFRIPVVYEIKAGTFLKWFETTDILSKWCCRFCLNNSDVLLCQGKSYVSFLENDYGGKVFYHPNFVHDSEIPQFINPKLEAPELRVLFVGYQFKEKGVFELVDACCIVSNQVPIILTLIGREQSGFKTWLDNISIPKNLQIIRLGILPHERILTHYQENDIYCYPTFHSGEGHNNTINEAMMTGMVIVTSKHGFLPDILNSESAYFVEEVSSSHVADCLIKIHQERDGARGKAQNARNLLLKNYTSEVIFGKLKSHYRKLFNNKVVFSRSCSN